MKIEFTDGSGSVPNTTIPHDPSLTVPVNPIIVGPHTVPYGESGTLIDGSNIQTTEYRYNRANNYVTPKYRVGSVVTYLEQDLYKMGKIKSAVFDNTHWRYTIMGANFEVYETSIKEVIHVDNQDFLKKL